MKIAMFTNTYTPHVGGVARSVELFTGELRRRGHGVLVVAPEFPDMEDDDAERVFRVPAIQRFNGSDFSFPVPVPGQLRDRLDRVRPQVIHSHHPFLLGGTALRVAAERRLPIVFTHHTLYERYTHYVPGDSPAMKRAAVELAVGYCNLCTAVIAPSRSVERLLEKRGVTTPIEVIPTGIELADFRGRETEAAAFRRRHGIPPDAFVVGHLGRLAEEKNLPLLTAALVDFLGDHPRAHALVVGDGPCRGDVAATCDDAGLAERLHLPGALAPDAVPVAYAAMDVFLFASTTETQGMVVTEAMAAGVPVVALDASGVREVVEDGENGRLIRREDEGEGSGETGGGSEAGGSEAERLTSALAWVCDGPEERRRRLREGARATAEERSLETTTDRLLLLYDSLSGGLLDASEFESSLWQRARARLAREWKIARNLARALGETLGGADRLPAGGLDGERSDAGGPDTQEPDTQEPEVEEPGGGEPGDREAG